MARPRFDNLEPERQERILAAAAEEFAERGYAGASVNRILEASGLSKGVLYYYFEDKKDLFATAVERATLRLFEESGMLGAGGVEAVERWVEGLGREDFWDGLRAMSRDEAAVAVSGTWYARLGHAWSRLRDEPEVRAATEPMIDVGRGMVRALVRRGRELGLIRVDIPEELLVDVFMAVDETTDRWFASRMGEAEGEALQALADVRIELMRDLLDARHEGWER